MSISEKKGPETWKDFSQKGSQSSCHKSKLEVGGSALNSLGLIS